MAPRKACWWTAAMAGWLALAACGSGGDAEPRFPGGARITFSMCGDAGAAQSLTVLVTDPAFVTEASWLLASGGRRVPVFRLVDGTGVDPQWTWHVDPATPVFADATIELCDGCPSYVEADKAYWLDTVQTFCPWSAVVTALEPASGDPGDPDPE